MEKTTVIINKNFETGEIDKHLYGTFLEHIDTIIYGSLYQPEHPKADKCGFRTDVLELLKDLGTTFIRYPGGNFVSGYHWKDGVGPREKRPRKYNLAWKQEESNQVGIDEFCRICEQLQIEPMLVANLGTGTSEEAAEELEYCNYDGNTQLAEERRKNGHAEPYNVRIWGLGNEMDGIHQIEHKTACEYARKAVETARMMKKMDAGIKLVLCGSCSPEKDLLTYPDWDRIVLEEAYDDVEYISLHRYYLYDYHPDMYANNTDTLEDIAHLPKDIGDYIETIAAAIRFVKGKRRSDKQVAISFDEWGVLSSKKLDRKKYPQWKEICQDIHSSTALDAVLHGGMLIAMLNHCDIVKMACQSIVIGAMIQVDPNGGCFRQTTFYPFRDVAELGQGTVLRTVTTGSAVQTGKYGKQPSVDSAVVYDGQKQEIVVFAVNYDTVNSIPMELKLQEFGELKCIEYRRIYEEEAFAGNTFEDPFRVVPHTVEIQENQNIFELPPISWNVIRFRQKHTESKISSI